APPGPEHESDGVRFSAWGCSDWPPRALQPLEECVERKFAHSLRFVLPRITTPAARRRAMSGASCGAYQPSRAREPAVVIIRSDVSTLCLLRLGMACRGT